MKLCNSCGFLLPLDKFGNDKRIKGHGKQGRCKECAKKHSKISRDARIDHYRERERNYVNANRERINERTRNHNRGNPRVLEAKKRWYEKIKHTDKYKDYVKSAQIKNKDAKRIYDREYRKRKTPEEYNAVSSEWRKNNPEKRAAIIATYSAKRREWEGSGMTGGELADWTESQEKICKWCEGDCSEDFHIDHVMPLSKGGRHEKWNLAISCPSCNYRKNAKHPLDWLAELGYDPGRIRSG